jgi:hypothetical protein
MAVENTADLGAPRERPLAMAGQNSLDETLVKGSHLLQVSCGETRLSPTRGDQVKDITTKISENVYVPLQSRLEFGLRFSTAVLQCGRLP